MGSTMGSIPVSNSTVATHIVLEPDIAGYSVDSRITKPSDACGSLEGSTMLALCHTAPRGSNRSSSRNWSRFSSR